MLDYPLPPNLDDSSTDPHELEEVIVDGAAGGATGGSGGLAGAAGGKVAGAVGGEKAAQAVNLAKGGVDTAEAVGEVAAGNLLAAGRVIKNVKNLWKNRAALIEAYK